MDPRIIQKIKPTRLGKKDNTGGGKGEGGMKNLSQVPDLRVYINGGAISWDKADWRMKGDTEFSFKQRGKPILLLISNH